MVNENNGVIGIDNNGQQGTTGEKDKAVRYFVDVNLGAEPGRYSVNVDQAYLSKATGGAMIVTDLREGCFIVSDETFQDCMTGPGGDVTDDPHCEVYDFNGDADVDLEDFMGIQRLYGGECSDGRGSPTRKGVRLGGRREEKGTSLIIASLSRPAGASQRELQTQPLGDSLNPIGVAEWLAAVDARCELLKLFLIKRSIDKSHPVSGPIHGPFAKGKRLAAMSPGEEPAPHPSLRPLDQPGPHGVGFHISADIQKMALLRQPFSRPPEAVKCRCSA